MTKLAPWILCFTLMTTSSSVALAADDLPEELPAVSNLSVTPFLSYGGAEKGFSFGATVTFESPKDQLFEEFFKGSGLDPFYCALEANSGDGWEVVVDTGFCQTGNVTLVGWADAYRLEPGTTYDFRVILYQDQGDGNANFIRKSPPSETITVTTWTAGVPELSSTCLNAFSIDPTDDSIPLSWKVDSGEQTLSGFELERTDEPGGEWMKVATIEEDGSITYKYTDSGLSMGDTFYYRVRAILDGEPGPWSNVIKEKALADKTWCDTDREVQDRAADAVGSDTWPGAGDPSGSGEGGDSGTGEDPKGDSSDPTDPGSSDDPLGMGGAAADPDGSASDDGCGCQVPGRAPGGGYLWVSLLFAGLVVTRRFAKAS